MASFWAEAGGSHNALSDLARRGPLSTEELTAVLDTEDLRKLFLKTALLLAFADGQVSGAESELVRANTPPIWALANRSARSRPR